MPAPGEMAPPGSNIAAARDADAAAKAAGRERFAADFRKMVEAAPPEAKATEEAAPAAKEPDAPAEVEAEAAAEPTEAAEPEEEKLDPATAKRLAASQRAERQQKERLAKERSEATAALEKQRAEIEAARKEIEAERKELAEFKALRGRAKFAPADVLRTLGLTDADYEIAAQELYALSPKGAADPKAREYVARLQREREIAGRTEKQGGEVAELRDQIAEMKKLIEASKSEQGSQAQANEYLDSVEESIVDDQHPILSRALTAAKAKAADRTVPLAERREAKASVKALRDEFLAAAVDLYQRDGIEPDPAEVAAEVESRRVAAIKRWGFDPAALTQPAAPPPKKPGAPPPKVLARGGGAPTTPAPKPSAEQMREKFIREREAGKISAG